MSLCAALATVVGANQVLTGDDALPYLTDWRGRYQGQALCVVRPGSTVEVAAVVRLCAEAGAPMVPQGGNTGLCGAATPDGSGRAVVINLSRLNRIRAIDADNDTITVEAGCKLASAQQAAAEAGRLLPLSLASSGSCEIGGNLSTNAGGVQVLRYGNTRDLTLGLEVVLPDGQIWDGLRGLRKDNTGYDLKQLFIGAEGTLGIITAAVLKLFPLPTATLTAWLAVADAAAAVALLGAAKQAFGARVTAFELVSRQSLEMVLTHIPGAADPLTDVSPWYVLLELSDSGDDALLRTAGEAFIAEQMDGLVGDGVLAASGKQAQRLWALRENISEAQKIEGISIKHDVSVPVSRIPEFLQRAGLALAQAFPGVRVVAFGHVGDGNLHYNLSIAIAQDNAAFIAMTPAVNLLVHDLVAELGGSISAEHGLGQLKREEVLRYKSPVEMLLMQRLKSSIDPLGLMNPGKVL
jgi:FAD/FMN-containing dehydrogenase